MNTCHVKSFVYYEHHPNDYVTEHSHNCFECVFYMNGAGTVTAEGDTLEYAGPTVTLVGPGIKHDEKTREFSRLYIILFEGRGMEIPKQFSSLSLNPEDSGIFLDLFGKMQEEEKEKKRYYKDAIDAYFSLALCRFLRETAVGAGRASPDKELVSRIKTYVKENYNQPIDFEQIASSFGYSYDRLRHIFRRQTNTSIHQYLLNCKLYAAKQMLLTTDMPIKDIAARCGFGSSIHFTNFFKGKMNISPRQFRNSQDNRIDVGVFKIEGEPGDKHDEKSVD